MKKIMLLLFLFLSIAACYLVYNLTNNYHKYYLAIGDILADNPITKEDDQITEYNTYFVNKDYRIIDLVNIIKYNEEIIIAERPISIHQLLKKADVIILSIGMNDIYYKLNDNSKNIYTYTNDMINNMEYILDEIDRYSPQKVIVLGYYNITSHHSDIFSYLNYKLKRIVQKHNFTYLELNDKLKNNPNILKKSDNFYLNNEGYRLINQILVDNLEKS